MSGVLVAGIGNIFAGDDGFGPEVANRLSERELPEGIRSADFGIAGLHLAFEVMEGWDALVLVDAVPMGDRPGTLAVIEPDPGAPADALDAHRMSPDVVLAALSMLGAAVRRIRIVGCQPATLEEGIGLSPAVAAAVGDAADLALEVARYLSLPEDEGAVT